MIRREISTYLGWEPTGHDLTANDLIYFAASGRPLPENFTQTSEEALDELTASIRQNGLLNPIIVQKLSEERFRILAGHNRAEAMKRLGEQKISAIVKECDDDQATLIMLETNLAQRKELLPSELAFAYKIQLDTLKHQGKSQQSTSDQVGLKLSSEEIASQMSTSPTQVKRYIPFDAVIGNVPFGNFSVYDPAYNPQNFLIHDYFFAKSLALTRPGGIVAFITSMGTLDKQDSTVRKKLAQDAELLGAVRLPRNAFGGTEVTADILFLQKRPQPLDIEPEWVSLGLTEDNIPLNQYFLSHPEMILGKMGRRSGQFGEEFVCFPEENRNLITDLRKALAAIDGQFQLEQEEAEASKETAQTLPPPADCKRFSFAVIDGALYYRETGNLILQQLPEAKTNRIKAIVSLRDGMREIIQLQLEEGYSETLLRGTL